MDLDLSLVVGEHYEDEGSNELHETIVDCRHVSTLWYISRVGAVNGRLHNGICTELGLCTRWLELKYAASQSFSGLLVDMG